MHITNTPTGFINEENLKKICAPAGKYLKHKNPYGRNQDEKNVECLVEIRVQHDLPFGSEVYKDMFAKPEWLEFSYKLFNLKLCKICRWLDHSTKTFE